MLSDEFIINLIFWRRIWTTLKQNNPSEEMD